MTRLDFAGGGAMSIARDASTPKSPLVNLRAIGRSGTVLLFNLRDDEVLALVRALLAGGETDKAQIAAERETLIRLCGVRS